MSKRTRIADVASAAGVSTATVSRTLSNAGFVGEETRARVMAAVEATGYRINGAARDLRSQRARSILILAPNLANTFFSRIFAAVQDEAAAAGLTVQISDSRVAGDRLAVLGHDGRADGILLLDGSLDAAMVNGWRLPLVQLCEWNDSYEAPALAIDNPGAARMAVDHLADLGHRSILHVEGPRANVLAITRREGFLAGAAARGIEATVLPGDFTMEAGAKAAIAWSAMEQRPTAVFCASDECAFGFISQCARIGHVVPRDVSVVGFDDVDFADCFIPPLATIHQPREAIGRDGARRLIDALGSDAPLPKGRTEITACFIPRATTQAPCARAQAR